MSTMLTSSKKFELSSLSTEIMLKTGKKPALLYSSYKQALQYTAEQIGLNKSSIVLIPATTHPSIVAALSTLGVSVKYTDVEYERMMPTQQHIDEGIALYNPSAIMMETVGGYLPTFDPRGIPLVVDETNSFGSRPTQGITRSDYTIYRLNHVLVSASNNLGIIAVCNPHISKGTQASTDVQLEDIRLTNSAYAKYFRCGLAAFTKLVDFFNEVFLNTPFIGMPAQRELRKWAPRHYWIKSSNEDKLLDKLDERGIAAYQHPLRFSLTIQELKENGMESVIDPKHRLIRTPLFGDSKCAVRDTVYIDLLQYQPYNDVPFDRVKEQMKNTVRIIRDAEVEL